jgi:hypothetical protein
MPLPKEVILVLHRFWCKFFVNILRILYFQCKVKWSPESRYKCPHPESVHIHTYRPYYPLIAIDYRS